MYSVIQDSIKDKRGNLPCRTYSESFPSEVVLRHGTQLFRRCYSALILHWRLQKSPLGPPYFNLVSYLILHVILRKHPRNEWVTSAKELGPTMSKNNLRGITHWNKTYKSGIHLNFVLSFVILMHNILICFSFIMLYVVLCV